MLDRWEIQKEVFERAAKDPEFKKRMLENPTQTLKQEFKGRIPEVLFDKYKFKFHQDTGNEIGIVLPTDNPKKIELTEAELEQLAGGDTLSLVLSVLGGYCPIGC